MSVCPVEEGLGEYLLHALGETLQGPSKGPSPFQPSALNTGSGLENGQEIMIFSRCSQPSAHPLWVYCDRGS